MIGKEEIEKAEETFRKSMKKRANMKVVPMICPNRKKLGQGKKEGGDEVSSPVQQLLPKYLLVHCLTSQQALWHN